MQFISFKNQMPDTIKVLITLLDFSLNQISLNSTLSISFLNWSIFIKNRYNFLVRKNDILITVGIRIFKFGMYFWFDIDFYEDCKPTLLEPFQGFNVVFQYIFLFKLKIDSTFIVPILSNSWNNIRNILGYS